MASRCAQQALLLLLGFAVAAALVGALPAVVMLQVAAMPVPSRLFEKYWPRISVPP
jgi:hypothetical protein